MFMLLKKLSTSRIIALGFALAILTGSILLMLPCSVRPGVHLEYIDSLYTSTSAVCVTGLVSVDAKDTFTPLGQFFLAMLIQIGGLGVTAIGAAHFVIHYKTFGNWNNAVYETYKVLGGFVLGLPHTATYFGQEFFSCGPMWYLLALMIGWILLDIILNIFPESYIKWAVLGTMLLGWGISLVWEAPFCIAQGMVTVPYLYIGFLAKKKRLFEKKFRPLAILGLLAAALGVALGVLLTGKTDCVSLGEWTMGPVSILLDGIVGLGFIVLFMKVQRLLDNPITHLIEAVGRRSLYIFCIHTVELTAVPWYLMVQKYAAAPTKGLWLQYAVSLGSIFLLCEILLRRRDVMLKFFPARRRHFAEHQRYVAKH